MSESWTTPISIVFHIIWIVLSPPRTQCVATAQKRITISWPDRSLPDYNTPLRVVNPKSFHNPESHQLCRLSSRQVLREHVRYHALRSYVVCLHMSFNDTINSKLILQVYMFGHLWKHWVLCVGNACLIVFCNWHVE